jgi:hypothetical protein
MIIKFSGKAIGVFGTKFTDIESKIVVDFDNHNVKITHDKNYMAIESSLWKVKLQKPVIQEIMPDDYKWLYNNSPY